MRMTLKKFKELLALAKSMPAGDARKAFIDNLKSAEVYDTDKDGKEVAVEADVSEVEVETKTADVTPAEAAHIKALEDRIAELEKKAAARTERAPGQRPPKTPVGPSIGKSYKIPDRVKRMRVKNFREYEGEATPAERAFKFAMFCYAAFGKSAYAAGFCEENGIEIKRVDDSGEGELHLKDGANTFNNANGAILIPEDIDNDIIDLREQYGVVRGLFRNVPMTRDTKTRHRRTGGLTASFVGETNAGTSSKKTWDAVSLTAKKLVAIALASNEFTEDVAGVLSWADDTAGEIGYAFAEKEDDCGINGDGTSTYGRIVGLRQKLSDVNGVDDGGGLILASGNAYSEIVLADFHKVIGRIPQYADGNDTAWLVHRTFWATVMQKLALASGGVPATEVINGVRTPMFLGYPVKISQKMPSTEGNSQICALFGQYAKAADFGDRRQTTISMSEHATVESVNVFETDQVAIKGTERFDVNVHDVGTSSVAGPVVGLITAAS